MRVDSTTPWIRTTDWWLASWNGAGMKALEVVRQREESVSALRTSGEHEALSPDEREQYLALGADLERAWHHERATPESRKRIVRALLVEIVANVEGDRIKLRLHWQGGDHTELTVRKNRVGQHRWATDAETGDVVRQLARLMPDRSIASLLNRAGKRTRQRQSVDRGSCARIPHVPRNSQCIERVSVRSAMS